jgi:hypothetical protein
MLLVSTPTGLLGDADVDRDGVFAVERSVHEQGAADATYIAALHPGVGKALADWLDSAAVDAEQIGPDHRALAVVRALLGSEPR